MKDALEKNENDYSKGSALLPVMRQYITVFFMVLPKDPREQWKEIAGVAVKIRLYVVLCGIFSKNACFKLER